MATVVNKTTFEVIYSANTPDYDPAFWVINPPTLDTLLANSVPVRYWKVSVDGLDIVEMSQAEKDAVDSEPVALAAAKAAKALALGDEAGVFLDGRYNNIKRDTLIGMYALALTARQKARRDYIASFLLWLQSLENYVEGIADSIDAAATIPVVNAITFDFTSFAATDPQVDVPEASRRKAVAY